MTILYQVRKELQKKGHQQQPDVHPIDIGISGDHDIIVPQILHTIPRYSAHAVAG